MSLTKATFSMIDGAVANVLDFDADPTGNIDCLSAFQAAAATGKAIFAPKGTYFFSDQLVLENSILFGEGQGVFLADAKTTLLFAPNKTGLYLTGQGTCRVSDLCVASQSTTAGAGVGIRVSSHGSLVENVLIYGFGQHGLQITTSVGENANNCLIKLVRAYANRWNGFNVGPGADPNACSLVMCDASDNIGIGFYSNAANTLYDHCHAANNGDVDFDEASGSNLFLLPYSESGSYLPTFRVSNAVFTGSLIIDAPFGEVGLTGNTANISQMKFNSNFGGVTQSAPFWINGGAGLYGFTNDLTYGFAVYDRTNNRFVKQWNLDQTQERNRALIMSDRGFGVVEGANARQGVVTLVGGTATVANTSVGAFSRIFLTSQVDGGTPGFLRVSSRVNGTSFTITSSSAADTSTVAYEIFEPGAASGTPV